MRFDSPPLFCKNKKRGHMSFLNDENEVFETIPRHITRYSLNTNSSLVGSFTISQKCVDYIESKGWKITTPTNISQGFYGSVYLLCSNNVCNAVAKVMDAGTDDVLFKNECQIQKLMASYQIAPQVLDCFTCVPIRTLDNPRRTGIIIQERMQITLKDAIKNNSITFEQVYPLFQQQIRKMLSLGIQHNDLHFQNIMINTTPLLQLKIIDWGNARYYADTTQNIEAWMTQLSDQFKKMFKAIKDSLVFK